MSEIKNQSCLEVNAIERRKEDIVRNDYSQQDEYSQTHPDAISDGDPLGKGSGHGGHTHSIPDCTKPKSLIDYSNFDTSANNVGGSYDINGRNGIGGREFLLTISKYNSEKQYGINSVDTTLNVQDGQIVIR